MHSKDLINLKNAEGYIDITTLLDEKGKEGDYLGSWITRPFLTEDNVSIYWKARIPGASTHIAEAICARIARQFDLRSTKYFLAKYNDSKGVITKNFLEKDETILWGRDFIKNYYKTKENDFKYITDMELLHNVKYVEEALRYYVKRHNEKTDPNEFSISKNDATKILESLLKTIMMDVATLNSDRHNQNWGLLVGKNRVRFIPVFDNDRAFLLFNGQVTMHNWFNDYLKSPTKQNAVKLENMFKKKSDEITAGISITQETSKEVTIGKHYLTMLKEFEEHYPAMFNKTLRMFYNLDIHKAIRQTEEETGVQIPFLVKLTVEHAYQTRYMSVRKQFGAVEENLPADKSFEF